MADTEERPLTAAEIRRRKVLERGAQRLAKITGETTVLEKRQELLSRATSHDADQSASGTAVLATSVADNTPSDTGARAQTAATAAADNLLSVDASKAAQQPAPAIYKDRILKSAQATTSAAASKVDFGDAALLGHDRNGDNATSDDVASAGSASFVSGLGCAAQATGWVRLLSAVMIALWHIHAVSEASPYGLSAPLLLVVMTSISIIVGASVLVVNNARLAAYQRQQQAERRLSGNILLQFAGMFGLEETMSTFSGIRALAAAVMDDGCIMLATCGVLYTPLLQAALRQAAS